jgi:hypothetical protein
MNDFTKEELEDIINWAEAYTEFGASWTFDCHKPLIDKIQFMIDHYQDHIVAHVLCRDCMRIAHE